jgi:hypothetical protein
LSMFKSFFLVNLVNRYIVFEKRIAKNNLLILAIFSPFCKSSFY